MGDGNELQGGTHDIGNILDIALILLRKDNGL